jgi:hypothetical protein
MQLLERAGLLMKALSINTSPSFYVGLTRLGWQALQTDTVRQHLGLSEAAPGGGTHGQR